MQRRQFLFSMVASGLWVACRGDGLGTDDPTRAPQTTTQSPTPPASPASSETPSLTPTTSPSTTPGPSVLTPIGFPLDEETPCGVVEGAVGSRSIVWGAGPGVRQYSLEDQAAGDPVRANRCGWNARTHVEYEGQPAVDWYVPVRTPVVATMDGIATLMVITVSNPFDVYGVDREPYLGDPDRNRAPLAPFQGPGGGKGVYVRIENEEFTTEYAHLELAASLEAVPSDAYLDAFAADSDYRTLFGPLRDFQTATAVAQWEVRRGDLIGVTGDSGYSEAPHLHYTVRRAGGAGLLCPTSEAGFADGGWLFRLE